MVTGKEQHQTILCGELKRSCVAARRVCGGLGGSKFCGRAGVRCRMSCALPCCAAHIPAHGDGCTSKLVSPLIVCAHQNVLLQSLTLDASSTERIYLRHRMVFCHARPAFLLLLALFGCNFQLSPAFTSAPSGPLSGARNFHRHARTGPMCLFGKPSLKATQPMSTGQLVPVTSDPDPMPYGQRMYPVHPDDLSPEDRKQGLAKMILAVGVRDIMMGMVTAFLIMAASTGFDFASPDYHFPVGVWLFSCLFCRLVTQDDVGPVTFSMSHASLSVQQGTAAKPSLKRSDSFANWRDTAINPSIDQPQTSVRVGAAIVPRLNMGTQRLVANFATIAPLPEDSALEAPSPFGFKIFVSMLWGFLADLVGAAGWVKSPKCNVPVVEDGSEEMWDPRDPGTPAEPGV